MAKADESSLDLCGGQDKIHVLETEDYKSDGGNQWQLPDITDPPSCFSHGQSVQQHLPIETSISVNVGGQEELKDPSVDVAETVFSKQVRVHFAFNINRCGTRIFVKSSPGVIDKNYN